MSRFLHSVLQHLDRLLPGINPCVLFWAQHPANWRSKKSRCQKEDRKISIPQKLRSAPPQGLPGPPGPEPWKSPKRVRKEYPGAGLQKCRKSAPQSLKRVRFGLFSDSFETSGRTLSALLGPLPQGPGRPCVGRGRSLPKKDLSANGGFAGVTPAIFVIFVSFRALRSAIPCFCG